MYVLCVVYVYVCVVCVCACVYVYSPISFPGDPTLVQLGVELLLPVTTWTGHHHVLIPAEAALGLFRHPNWPCAMVGQMSAGPWRGHQPLSQLFFCSPPPLFHFWVFHFLSDFFFPFGIFVDFFSFPLFSSSCSPPSTSLQELADLGTCVTLPDVMRPFLKRRSEVSVLVCWDGLGTIFPVADLSRGSTWVKHVLSVCGANP